MKFKQLFQWILAIIISFIIMDIAVLFYSYDPGWIKRSGGATPGIYEAGKSIVKSDEGFSITKVDDNGYLNKGVDLDESYILILGNSQTNGTSVMPDQKYVELVNRRLEADKQSKLMQTYNVSNGGADFCDIVQGFEAAIKEYPQSEAVVLQISTLDLPLYKLQNCINQRAFSEEMTGAYLQTHLNVKQKTRNMIKNYFPLIIYLLDMKLSRIEIDFSDAFWYHNPNTMQNVKLEDDFKEYGDNLNIALEFLRNSYKGRIIILYLPQVELNREGLKVIKQNQETVFSELCSQNNIIYYNLGSDFEEGYALDGAIPYGFPNTRLGYGHLNQEGHKMVANALHEILTSN